MRKGITRVKGGYLARHYYGHKNPVSQYFYDIEYDGGAYVAAERFLAWAEANYPKVPKVRKPGISKTFSVERGTRVPCYEVFWTVESGQKKNKKFRYWNDLEEIEAKSKADRFVKELEKGE